MLPVITCGKCVVPKNKPKKEQMHSRDQTNQPTHIKIHSHTHPRTHRTAHKVFFTWKRCEWRPKQHRALYRKFGCFGGSGMKKVHRRSTNGLHPCSNIPPDITGVPSNSSPTWKLDSWLEWHANHWYLSLQQNRTVEFKSAIDRTQPRTKTNFSPQIQTLKLTYISTGRPGTALPVTVAHDNDNRMCTVIGGNLTYRKTNITFFVG